MMKSFFLLLLLIAYTQAADFVSVKLGESTVIDPPQGSAQANVVLYTRDGKTEFIINVEYGFPIKVFYDDDCLILSQNEDDTIVIAGSYSCRYKYTSDIISPSYTTGAHPEGYEIDFGDNPCPEGYTELKSDFVPELQVDTSSLYLNGDEPSLQVNFKVKNYYFDVEVTYADQCTAPPSLESTVVNCDTLYKTSIDYVKSCPGLKLEKDGEERFIYRGVLHVTAVLRFQIDGYILDRNVGAPISWQLYIDRTINVNADVTISNDYHCFEDADCTDSSSNCEGEDGDTYDCGIDEESPDITGCCIKNEEDPSVGTCNCKCGDYLSGYTGTYCQVDLTYPEAIAGQWNDVNFDSYLGGCINAGERGILPPRGLSDNSGDEVAVIDVNIGSGHALADGADDKHCFEIGTTTVTYTFEDSSGNRNIISYDVTINDRGAPVVDCYNCQYELKEVDTGGFKFEDTVADGFLNVCAGDKDGWTLTTMSETDFILAGADNEYKYGYAPTVLPGQVLSIAADNYLGLSDIFGFISCSCKFESGADEPYNVVLSNSWEKWRTKASFSQSKFRDVTAFDSTEGSIVVPAYPNPGKTGKYGDLPNWMSDPIIYIVTDSAGNKGTCHLDVTYDTEVPTCDGFVGTFSYVEYDGPDPNNYNFSIGVTYPDVIGFADPDLQDGSSGSGFPSSLSDDPTILTPPRVNGAQYPLTGNTSQYLIKSQYILFDKVGNQGVCDWAVTLLVSVCQWDEDPGIEHPYCDDTQPQIVDETCDALSASYNCDYDTEGCGCGDFIPPSFIDDKGAENLKISVNWNGNDVDDVKGFPQAQLSLGGNDIEYTATDVHGQTATCKFTVHYEDTTAPLVGVNVPSTDDGCPADILYDSDEVLCVYSGTTYDTYSVKYIGRDECVLDTTVFEWQTYTPENMAANQNHQHIFTIYDASNNPRTCNWNTYVADCAAPVITCGGPYNERNAQGSTSSLISFQAIATDSSYESPAISYEYGGSVIVSPHPFDVGSHTVTATATDSGYNTDTCDITITIYKGYPYGTFDAVLSAALISQSDNGFQGDSNGDIDFSGDINFITFTNRYHSVDAAISTANDSNDNGQITQSGALTATTVDCALTAAVCREDWTFQVAFEDCDASKKYDIAATVTCDAPADHNYPDEPACQEADVTYSFSITLVAANYCWQELASIKFENKFITVSLATFDAFVAASPSYATLPSAKTSFKHQEMLVGIIAVSSEAALTKSLTIVEMLKTHYSESTYTTKVDTNNADWTDFNVLAIATTKCGTDWCSFRYPENTVPLENTHYIEFAGIVELTFFKGQTRRRSLLQVDTTEETRGQTTTAEAAIFAESSTVASSDIASPDDAVVVMKLQNCADSTPELEAGVASAIAAYLRIAQDRVSVAIDSTTDGCFVTVTVAQAACDSITITELLQQLEQATRDPFNELHGYIYNEQDIPSDMTFDSSVFFVQQQPQSVLSSDASTSSTTGSSESMDWYVLLAIGAAVGGIIGTLYIHQSKKSSSSVEQPEERRFSVAELLASNFN